MEFASTSGRTENFDKATLILPGASIGNVGQLAVDLLINNWQLPLIGQILNASVLPCFGGNAFSKSAGSPSTELQVFGDENLVVIQQRATTPLGQQVAFAESIASWIRGAKFKQVLLLGSIDAELRRGAQLEGSQLRYVCHSLSSALARTCQELGYIVLEEGLQGENAYEDLLLPPWPMWRCLKQEGVPVLLLSAFASEGNNIPDAAALASYAAAVLQQLGLAVEIGDWKPPISWIHMFGPRHHSAMY